MLITRANLVVLVGPWVEAWACLQCLPLLEAVLEALAALVAWPRLQLWVEQA